MSAPHTDKDPAAHGAPPSAGVSEKLRHAIDHAAHLLPAQGPITVFIHHNTLHAFEHLPFHEALRVGARVFGNEPYLPEHQYRQALVSGRIRSEELEQVLRQDLGAGADEPVAGLATRFALRFAMLQHPVWSGTSPEMNWLIEESDSLRRLRPEASAANRLRLTAETRRWVMRDLRGDQGDADDTDGPKSEAAMPSWLPPLLQRFSRSAIEVWPEEKWDAFTLESLWNICLDGLRHAPLPETPPIPLRHRDLLLAVANVDTDLMVNDVLVRFCAAYLDQGFSQWSLPARERGFYQSFLALFSQSMGPPHRWMRGLSAELGRIMERRAPPLELIHESLEALGVAESEWDDFLAATLLSLRGWGGMIRQVEIRSDSVAYPIPQESLIEFVAIRLLLDRWALAYAAKESIGYRGPPHALRQELRNRLPAAREVDAQQRAFLIFMLAQVLGWTPSQLFGLSPQQWHALIREVEAFPDVERRRIFQLAYEHRFRVATLDAIALRSSEARASNEVPRFQLITCIDEREESMRRHMEEIAPDCETFGAAGFFSVAMYYRGAADAHFVPLCPIVIRPQHWIVEQVDDSMEALHRQRARARQQLGKAAHHLHVGSRGVARGAMFAAVIGVFASIPLVARILFPQLAARARRWFGQYVQSPPKTRLRLERSTEQPGRENGSLGYSVAEMTNILERLLRDIGLTQRFSRFVLVVGHGSNSLNNPHRSAYDCGACGGSAGGPNARAFAQIANDPRVRENLKPRGIAIPDSTHFVGGLHNTCDDSVTLMDVDRIPESHQQEFQRVARELEEASQRNAHERSRRFMSARLNLTADQAKEHVEERSEDLAQARPELGHATNAICVIGRRYRTRGLFLDRRAFLISYDPTQDDQEASILTRTLQAVVPVCSGINLEYYFSRVDPPGWGCGTKLPHNITSLLGVMDGAASDLRTGLPVQMTEVHEPLRLLFVMECEHEKIQAIIERHPNIGRMFTNDWVQLASLDPHTPELRLFKNGKFEHYEPQSRQLPRRPTSSDWYRGLRDHLDFAVISDRAAVVKSRDAEVASANGKSGQRVERA